MMDPTKCSVKLFVGGIQPTCQEKDLKVALKEFVGHIRSIDIKMKNSYLNRGYAFIFVDNEATAEAMIKRKIRIGERVLQVQDTNKNSQEKEEYKLKRLYLKNIPPATCDKELSGFFEKFGEIRSSYIIKDLNGYTKDYGFIDFQRVEDVDTCLEHLKWKPLVVRGQKIRVRRFIKVEDKKSQGSSKHTESFCSFKMKSTSETPYRSSTSKMEHGKAPAGNTYIRKQQSSGSSVESHEDPQTSDCTSRLAHEYEPNSIVSAPEEFHSVWITNQAAGGLIEGQEQKNCFIEQKHDHRSVGGVFAKRQNALQQSQCALQPHSDWVYGLERGPEFPTVNQRQQQLLKNSALCSKFAKEGVAPYKRVSNFSKHSSNIDWNHRLENIQFKVGGASPSVHPHA